MPIDRLDDQLAADRRGPDPDKQPDIPNGPARLPITPDSREPDTPGSRETKSRAEFNAEYRSTVEAVYRQDAVDRGYERIRETEEHVVTPAMHRIEAEDPDRRLVGLKFRLKEKERLTEKVNATLEEQPDLSPAAAVAVVKDAIRYTFQYPEDKYTAGVYADCARLEAEGFEPTDRRNTWQNEEYKGINSRWREPETGQVFEVQFHTQASFEAKQLTHDAYKKLRTAATSKAEQEDLVAFERRISARVPVPPDASDIPDYLYS